MMNCRWTKLFTSNILLTWHFISSADSERLQICSNFVVHPLIIEIILAPRETLFKLCDKYHRTSLSISSDDGTKDKKYLGPRLKEQNTTAIFRIPCFIIPSPNKIKALVLVSNWVTFYALLSNKWPEIYNPETDCQPKTKSLLILDLLLIIQDR